MYCTVEEAEEMMYSTAAWDEQLIMLKKHEEEHTPKYNIGDIVKSGKRYYMVTDRKPLLGGCTYGGVTEAYWEYVIRDHNKEVDKTEPETSLKLYKSSEDVSREYKESVKYFTNIGIPRKNISERFLVNSRNGTIQLIIEPDED